jgi:hypothetical protein
VLREVKIVYGQETFSFQIPLKVVTSLYSLEILRGSKVLDEFLFSKINEIIFVYY